MTNEKRLIDANALKSKLEEHRKLFIDAWGSFSQMPTIDKVSVDTIDTCISDVINAPTVDAYTGEQVDSIIQKADLLEIENRNLEQEVDWLKNCLNCEIRNKCPRHCGKVVHGCDHWIDGDPMVHGRWIDNIDENGYLCNAWRKCSACGGLNYSKRPPYCPNCGAKMDGDGNGN